MNRRQRQLCCRLHLAPSREWSALSFEQRATIAQAHFRAGLRQVKCRCGEYVWPWNLAHETLVASGLRWGTGYVAPWVLMRRDAAVGCLVPWWCGEGKWEAHRYYRQSRRGVGYRVVHVGSLAECARRLVGAVG